MRSTDTTTMPDRTQLKVGGFFASQAFSFLSLTCQLGIVTLAIWRFRIEDARGLPALLPLIFGGFIVHYLLPKQYRRPFFLLLSIAGIFVVLPFPQSLILVAMSFGLVGICHLPIAFWARVGLILAIAALLTGVRAGWIAGSSLQDLQLTVLPVLAAMFMCRLAIYLYDLRHEATPATLTERLSYFFLLPNVSFLLFPIVDYQTFRRTYYNSEEHAIYQKGVQWMVRGLTHLLLYRFVYQYLILPTDEINDLNKVVLYIVTAWLVYLRISGQFHLIIGILCLFGFNLPETHHLYFLCSNFTEFWRRTNIYWTNFMVKLVYYPVFLGLRRRFGNTSRIVVSTVMVFLVTWLVHSYQWFWLRGSFPITVNDAFFWGYLGLMVIINSLAEARGKRKLPQKTLTIGTAVSVSLKTLGFFALMCVMWSVWSSSSVREWLEIVSRAANSGAGDVAKLVTVAVALVAGGVLIQFATQKRVLSGEQWWFMRSPAFRVVTVASLLVLVTFPYVRRSLGREPQSLIANLRQDQLNERDQQEADQGYYEGLLGQGGSNAALLGLDNQIPEDWINIVQSDIIDQRDDLLDYELKASYAGVYKQAEFSTNRWRMRDKEHEKAKPEGVYRIALLGASYEMGSGVKDEEVYAAVLEDLLNANNKGPYTRFEVLNFGVGGYSLVHKALVAEKVLPAFAPDLVISPTYSTEDNRMLNHVYRAIQNNIPIPYSDLNGIVERAGVKLWMSDSQVLKLLKQHAYDFTDWSFRKLKADSQQHGWSLIVPFMSATTDRRRKRIAANLDRLWEGALASGVDAVRLENVFLDYNYKDIRLTRWDSHPNALGHRLVANQLYKLLQEREPRLFMKLDTAVKAER